MWRDIWFLATRTLLMTFRKRSTLILYFGLPIAGIVATFLLYGSVGTTELRVGVVNEDSGQRIAEDTVGFVKNLDHVSIVHVSRNELKEQLAANKLDSGLIIDSGFSESVLSGSPDHIAIESVKGAQVTGYMKSMLRGYIDNVAAMGKIAGGDGTTFQQIYDQYRSSAFKLTSESVNDTSLAKQMSYQSIGFLLLFMLNSAASLAELMLKHRENRTYYRILSSPINAKTYVLANIAVNAVVMLAQIVIALFFMKVVFHMDPGISVFEMFALLAIFAVVSISLSLVIIAFSKSSGMAGALQNLIIVPTCLLSGCFFPLSIMPETLRRVSDFLPQSWVLQSIEKLQEGATFGSIGFHLSILLAFAVVFFLIATYKFGRNNDTRNFV
ncbi:ABC transporter permease [Paenibacillus sp. FSL M7-1455]|jgi:ABC-2 type transport system permease protein|uniref:Transport permease protein n=1 Tax=Paenibacillus cookii TaxID=157839 RepID=A0ABQ4LTS0_9BACL|nr:ABC transporter permease [Paenibacillus cookii]KHF32585.1 ABC-2 family transporter protein [Paenibacillus sp. P1XP2]GIO66667.1 transport permease protein [Paenibacillus cookii]HWO53931.1 ABC transporter permease [Paenibacillus cookii]